MKIKQITRQNRRDFTAIYECEGCGHKKEGSGYDDNYFHENVVPKKICDECGKSRIDLGVTSEATTTKYPSWMTV